MFGLASSGSAAVNIFSPPLLFSLMDLGIHAKPLNIWSYPLICIFFLNLVFILLIFICFDFNAF